MRKLQLKPPVLKPGMNFLGHAICAGCCTPHKSTSALQGDVCYPPKKHCIIGKSESYKYCQDINQNWNNVFQINLLTSNL